jgi:hypothetical protein
MLALELLLALGLGLYVVVAFLIFEALEQPPILRV